MTQMLESAATRRLFIMGAMASVLPQQALSAPHSIQVWKSPTCGCCSAWVAHLVDAGFSVSAQNVSDDELQATKARLGVPTSLRSCHTASVGGYVIEGHVPAGDIKLLLSFEPEIMGLAVPGMPIGSPGMEMGNETERYDTIAFGPKGPIGVFAQH